MMTYIYILFEWLKHKIKYVLLAVIICIGGLYTYNHYMSDKSKPVVTYSKTISTSNGIQHALNVTPAQAVKLQKEIQYVQTQPPISTVYITAHTLHDGAVTTAKLIKDKSPLLPVSITEHTDRTAVVENTEKQKVDVYKINLEKPHKVKAGIANVDSKTYATIGLQAGRWEGQYMRSQDGKQGGAVMYTLKEW